MSTLTWQDLGQTFDGPHATPTRRASGPYFLNIASLKSGRLDLSESDHVSDADFAQWTKRVAPRPDDLLFSYETRLGEAALMPDGVVGCLGRRMALLRPDISVVDPRFLLYFFLSPGFQKLIAERAVHGATVDRIPLSNMGSWPVELPSMSVQRGIAEVLGAFDDKIAANLDVASCAAALIPTMFTATVRACGQPGTIGDIAEVVSGVSYRAADLQEGGTGALVTLKCVGRDGSFQSRGFKAYAGTPKGIQRLVDGEILIAKTDLTQAADVIGRAVRVETSEDFDTYTASLDVAIARPREGATVEYLHGALSQPSFQEYCRAHSSGTTVLHLKRGAIESFSLSIASAPEQRRYSDLVQPLYARAASARRESRNLAKARDELLPLLMSGKLTVKDAEKRAEEVL